MSIDSFEKLEVWKHSHALALLVYSMTRALPVEERFGLQAQMRRAAVSVPANIAEGFKRRGLKDKARFYNIAQGSLEELRYYLMLCNDLNYLIGVEKLRRTMEEIGKMLTGLVRATYGQK